MQNSLRFWLHAVNVSTSNVTLVQRWFFIILIVSRFGFKAEIVQRCAPNENKSVLWISGADFDTTANKGELFT